MKIVLAFDSFKGCLSSQQACRAAAGGVRQAFPDAQVVEVPVSDGGEGLTSVLTRALGGRIITIGVHGPLMEPVEAHYGISADGQTAILEMAEACGLPLVPPELRNPERTTTYGFGQMLADAIRRGCSHVLVGIGGSATCDAGLGMMQALRDEGIDRYPDIVVACDVQNPLNGPDGAACVFAPQKGADPAMVQRLDRMLTQLLAAEHTTTQPGDGAAGGLAFALRHWLHATLRPGIGLVLDTIGFDDLIRGADAVVTGEGKSDLQTLMGKVPAGILERARRQGIVCHLLSGQVEHVPDLLAAGFASVRSIHEGDVRSLSELMQPSVSMANLARSVGRLPKL